LAYNIKKGINFSTAVNFVNTVNNWTAAEFKNVNKENGALGIH
jgi:hypothetical protein